MYIFREGKGERKRGSETSMCGCLLRTPHWGTWPATQACALTGNQTSDPLVCRPALNPLSHASQGLHHYSFICKRIHSCSQMCSPVIQRILTAGKTTRPVCTDHHRAQVWGSEGQGTPVCRGAGMETPVVVMAAPRPGPQFPH